MCVDGKGELWESALSSASEEFKGSDSDPQACIDQIVLSIHIFWE